MAYGFVARRREFFYRISRFLWGRPLEVPSYDITLSLFFRCLGLIYFAAFVSFGLQVPGLIGEQGILPLADYLNAVHRHYGAEAYWQLPGIFWFKATESFVQRACYVGAALALLVVCNVATRLALVGLFVLYLSVFYAGQVFTTFQWDLLLIETGFLAIFVSTRSPGSIGMLRWLAFRFVFLAGAAKILSGDPTWRDWSALSYHFETQPLPTAVAWYAHHWPQAVQECLVAATLLVELLFVFLIFAPRRLRFLAAYAIIAFEVGIILTGNYNFFNLLTVVIGIPLFDDQWFRSWLPSTWARRTSGAETHSKPRILGYARGGLFAVLLTISLGQMVELFSRTREPSILTRAFSFAEPLHIVNTYGLFAVMTRTRPEIVIEASDDGQDWKEYGFRYKPGNPKRRPPWNTPHQPRLDWQLWFAALDPRVPGWFEPFLARLLEGSKPVLDLMGENPFSDHTPKYVRAVLYDYRFSDQSTGEKTGLWWVRELSGIYYPAVSQAQTQ